MERPFCLEGSCISLIRYIVSATNGEVETRIRTTSIETAEFEKQGLEVNGFENISINEFDQTENEWLEGVDVGSCSMERAMEIWQMGKESYMKSLEAPEENDYLFDLMYRVALIELGIN